MAQVIEMKKGKNGVFKKVALAAGGALASVNAFAVDHSAAISAAQTDATTNTTTAVTAVIAIAAVVMGVGIVLKLLNR